MTTTQCIVKVRQYLERPETQQAIAQVAPGGIDAQKLTKSAIIAIGQNPDLLKCTQESLARSVICAAEFGLSPARALGQVFFVPFWDKDQNAYVANMMIGYKGFILLMYRAGIADDISTRLIYRDEVDGLQIIGGSRPDIIHPINPLGLRAKPFQEENIVGGYCIIHRKNGLSHYEFMTYEQIKAVQRCSRRGNVPPWTTHWEQMARKTVIRRAANYFPIFDSAEGERFAKALEYDDEQVGIDPAAGEAQVDEVYIRPGVKRIKQRLQLPRQASEPVEIPAQVEPQRVEVEQSAEPPAPQQSIPPHLELRQEILSLVPQADSSQADFFLAEDGLPALKIVNESVLTADWAETELLLIRDALRKAIQG